jgi:DNA gyrase subunit A
LITAANSSSALANTDAGSLKVTAIHDFPVKGRATGGVRGHKFIRNEDQLYAAILVSESAVACTHDGKPLDLPAKAKRDASGNSAIAIFAGAGKQATS